MEKRRQERTHIEPLEIVIEEIDSGRAHYKNVTIFIEEVSQDGMRFSTNVELNVEEIIYFRLPSFGIADFISGKIAWKEEVEAGFSLYGLQL